MRSCGNSTANLPHRGTTVDVLGMPGVTTTGYGEVVMDDYPLLHAANTLERVVEQIEQATSLDPPPMPVGDAVAQAIPERPGRKTS